MFKRADGYYYNSNLIVSYYLVCVKGNKTHWNLRATLINNEEIIINGDLLEQLKHFDHSSLPENTKIIQH